MKLKIFTVGVIALTLTACFLDSNDNPYTAPVGGIDVISVSGVTVTLDGRLTRPCATNAQNVDYLVIETIVGTSGTRTEYLYTSTNGTCSGVETIESVSEVTFKTGSVMAITGWVDLGGILVDPPLAKDGSSLLTNESVTSLTITINSVIPANSAIPPGTEVPAFYVVDDTVAGTIVVYGISDVDVQKALNVPMTLQ